MEARRDDLPYITKFEKWNWQHSPEIFLLDDVLQMPSQGWVHFVILGWCGLLFERVTNSERGLGHLGESCYYYYYYYYWRKIILIEVLFAKINFWSSFKKLHFQKTHIGLVYLTKHVLFSPSCGAACAWLKGRQILYWKPQVSGISLSS